MKHTFTKWNLIPINAKDESEISFSEKLIDIEIPKAPYTICLISTTYNTKTGKFTEVYAEVENNKLPEYFKDEMEKTTKIKVPENYKKELEEFLNRMKVEVNPHN